MRGLLIPLLILLVSILSLLFRPSSGSAPDPSSGNPILPLNPEHETYILAAPDGSVYLVDMGSGEVLWSFSSGDSIYSSFHQISNHEGEKLYTPSADGDDFYIDCGEDWKLYLHGKGLKKVKLPLSAEELVKRTPFVAGGGVLLGSKKSSVFLVDAVTGKLVRTFRNDDILAGNDTVESSSLSRTEIEEWLPPSPVSTDDIEKLLYVTRTDYALSYRSVKTGKVTWYLMFAEIEASFLCDSIGSFPDDHNFRQKQRLDMNLPMHCHSRPVVHRIRNRSSLESLFVGNRVQDTLLGDILRPLPAPDYQEFVPGDKSLALFFDRDVMLPDMESMIRTPALPGNDVAESMLALPAPDSGFNVEPSSPQFRFWPVLVTLFWPFTVFSILLVTAFKGWGQRNLHKQPKDSNVQKISTRKKKGKRVVSKQGVVNSTTLEENPQPGLITVPSENRVSDNTHGPSLDQSDGNSVEGRRIGRMILTNKEIARGSNGTIVFEGTFDGRVVAVKRLVKAHLNTADKEMHNLRKSDQHPNIVRWYGVEYDQDFVYLCLERCACNLHDLISSCASVNRAARSEQMPQPISDMELELWKCNGYPSPWLLKLMRDIVCGLAHLHELKIIHRDLKPQNVLVTKDRSLSAKISDLGISKHLDGELTSLTRNTAGFGTSGWRAPEQIRCESPNCAVDLFSLGCVLFFCITGGFHPFGESFECDVNVVNDRKDLFLIDHIPEAVAVISQLLEPDPTLRPTAQEVMNHPLFWDSETRLAFFKSVSDRVELEDQESELRKDLEDGGRAALGGKWDEKMDTAFMNDIGRYRRYKYDSVCDLLRVIRNKLNHYGDLSKEVQETLGPVPDGYDSYFSVRFPKLLIDVYFVIRKHCEDESIFRKYFRGT